MNTLHIQEQRLIEKTRSLLSFMLTNIHILEDKPFKVDENEFKHPLYKFIARAISKTIDTDSNFEKMSVIVEDYVFLRQSNWYTEYMEILSYYPVTKQTAKFLYEEIVKSNKLDSIRGIL